ncbi:MAG TPA: NAD(P)-dependent oxidoreductase [Phototrophicaceae bacterium]|nr:NAD(P)-dependent oxidoreductase [Phototrophicaceae bacterium]
MRVLVTGASGFVGSCVVRCLINAGCEVVALVSPEHPLPRLQAVTGKIQLLSGRLPLDVTLVKTIKALSPERCIHLAWNAEPGQYLQSPQNVELLNASLQLLQALIDAGCQKVLMVGTCAEYDTRFGYLHEETPTQPSTLYAACKLSSGLIAQEIAATAGIQFIWARLFYLYGPWENERRMLPALIRTLLEDRPFPATAGAQVRDYLQVEDAARALCHLLLSDCTGVYNIASGVPVTIRQLMEMTGRMLGRSEQIQFGTLPYRQWDPMFICGNNQKLLSTGWTPQYTIETGLRHTIEWWQGYLNK